MSRQATKRAIAIDKDFEALSKNAAKTVADLTAQTAAIKVLTVFLHDNLLTNKGDLSEGDRVDLRDVLVPLYPQIQNAMNEITALFNIHDDDLETWQSNFNAYLALNPTVLDEALNRYPKVR